MLRFREKETEESEREGGGEEKGREKTEYSRSSIKTTDHLVMHCMIAICF